MRPRLIVTTCGISLLTNTLQREHPKWLYSLANAREQELSPADREAVGQLAQRASEVLAAADAKRARELSAELNVIVGFYGAHWPAAAKSDIHYLLHTDTFLGRLAAEILAAWLRRWSTTVELYEVDALTVRNTDELHWGVSKLVEWCVKVVRPFREQQYHVVFNLTGGFKAVHGILNTLGMIYADEIVYIFEGQSDLVRIPRLPVRLDAEETIRRHLRAFRRMAIGMSIPPEEAAGIPEALVLTTGSGVSLSGWGKLVWEETWRSLYQEQLLEPPIERIRYGPRFASTVADYAGTKRMTTINQRIDDLARFLLFKTQGDRLDFKPVRGGAMAPSTHEMDAWHDGDAPRIYCHFEGDVVVLDRLGEALH